MRRGYALSYLRDPAWLDTLDPVARADFEGSDPDGRDRLAGLRERIVATGCRTVVYREPRDLGGAVRADLEALVDPAFPGTEASQPARSRPRRARSVCGHQGGRFRAPPGPVASIDAHVASERVMVATGPPGRGATAVAASCVWASRADNPHDVVIEHYVSAGGAAAALAEPGGESSRDGPPHRPPGPAAGSRRGPGPG
jgi:hypothetical protein